MAELCLMASHGYPSGVFFQPPEYGTPRHSKDYHLGFNQDSLKLYSSNSRLHQTEELLKPIIGMLEANEIFRTHSTIRRPELIDVQVDFPPNLMLFSFRIAEQCAKHERALRFLLSGSSELERGEIDLALLLNLMRPQAMTMNMRQGPLFTHHELSFLDAESQPSLISPISEFWPQKTLLVGDSGCGYHTHLPDDQLSFTSSGAGMKDVLAALSEFYSSNNSIKWKKQPMLVPYFDRRVRKAARTNNIGPSSKLETVKSSKKVKERTSPKKRSNIKAGKEREIYRNNYSHACESLLSLMVDKKRQRRTALLSLKKSGPEIPKLLTQFSASIAGTGLAVLFSVVCKVACGRVPFCASKLLNTGLGLGLVWLSWAVNKLRDTVISINKNSGKLGEGEEEMMCNLDRSVREIYIRAVTLMVVAVLRFA